MECKGLKGENEEMRGMGSGKRRMQAVKGGLGGSR